MTPITYVKKRNRIQPDSTSVILSVRYGLIRVDPDFNTARAALYDDFLKNVIFNSEPGRSEIE